MNGFPAGCCWWRPWPPSARFRSTCICRVSRRSSASSACAASRPRWPRTWSASPSASCSTDRSAIASAASRRCISASRCMRSVLRAARSPASMPALTLMRVVQALGGSAGFVIGRAIVRDRCEPHEAARAFSLLMMIVALGPVLAPVARRLRRHAFRLACDVRLPGRARRGAARSDALPAARVASRVVGDAAEPRRTCCGPTFVSARIERSSAIRWSAASAWARCSAT